jgi:hypothetical protein
MILNNMTSDYDIHLAMMEKCKHDIFNPFTIDEIREDLNHGFERLKMKANETNEEMDEYYLIMWRSVQRNI